jgi:hypothetical protein
MQDFRSWSLQAGENAAGRVLDRLEIELARHGGMDNGRLPVTYDDFQRYGTDRHAIAPAIGELVALGFIKVTEHGRAGDAEWRKPNQFRITYKHMRETSPTHEWKRIETSERAKQMNKKLDNGRQPIPATRLASKTPVGKTNPIDAQYPHANC